MTRTVYPGAVEEAPPPPIGCCEVLRDGARIFGIRVSRPAKASAGGLCVPRTRTDKGTSASMQWFLCLLCASIFAWGFQAKLSLYQRPTPTHTQPAVKLCQDDQAGKQVCEIVVQDGSLPVVVSMCGAPAPFRPRLTIRRDRQVSKWVSASIRSYPNALFFRPPPTFKI